MGNFNITPKDSSPDKKCQKTENACGVNKLDSCNSQESCSPCHHTYSQRWDNLPYVALVEIYKHLSNNDKASMGLVCKDWLMPFTRPALWRRGHFRFDGYGDQRALQYAALMGSALRHVVVDCSAATKDKVSTRVKASSVRFCLFMSSLMTVHNRQLETLSVRNLCRLFRYWIHRNHNNNDGQYAHGHTNPVTLLINILEMQQRIRIIDVTNAGVLTDQAIRLIGSVQHPCHVEALAIAEVVAQIQRFDLAQNPLFISTIASFTGLNELRLSEEYISHELLMALSSSVALTLCLLEISVLYKIRRHPNEGLETSWAFFCRVMTKLKIYFIVKGVFAGRDIARVLPSTIRVSRLDWDLGNSVIDYKSFYLHLIKFKDFLQCLKLTLYFAMDSDVIFLSYAIHRLSNLRALHIDCPMIPPLLLYQLERSLRRCISNGPPEDRALKEIVINGTRLDPTETWYSFFAGLMMQQTLNWSNYISCGID